MKLSVWGLGYVGTVSAGCLAQEGHEVIGVDSETRKVDLINAGKPPIIEKDIGQIIERQVAAGRLSATTQASVAVRQTDLFLICVGTPSRSNGDIELKYVRRVCEEIGTALRDHQGAPVVVIRSTMLPGTMREVVIPTLETFSGRRAGAEFGICINPEFLREGTAVHDFFNPPKTVIGEFNRASGDLLANLYARIAAPLIRTDIETAEMVKYADNAWHALKVGFANEIGNVCKGIEVDSHRVMDIFCQDTKLNLSPYYLKPGFAFGGSCLPKDLRAITYKAKELDVEVPLLNSILLSNRQQIERAVDTVLRTGRKNVGVLGLSFKAGTDDLRESPMVTLIETLIGKGLKLTIYDRDVELARLFGANKQYIEREIPHISSLMNSNLSVVIEQAEIIIIGKKEDEFRVLADKMNNGRMIV